ncbi:transcriptional regulator, TetR family [Pelagirhabdus alkalitolerans]|uniref:Transcriptional regulator, TetR family n=1 Tax=Pelagirhabdus alkalitolerans TaxID=1612202 RepID=A0A1G6IMZ7_9BACI|nr:TetR family transcriptional regulator [Pelagirhabdus alkalitolerans]SDC07146.1 transcriptional regulator, TetR family [Pelagirhabdus alkalitolerans]
MRKLKDPRIIRTRKLMMNALFDLSTQKDLHAITVKDITSQANINRATFYYHFKDKYDLFEQTFKEDFNACVVDKLSAYDEVSEDMLRETFYALMAFQDKLSHDCRKNYDQFESTIEALIKDTMVDQFYRLLNDVFPHESEQSHRLKSVALSHGLHGMLTEWRQDSSTKAEDFVQMAIPILMSISKGSV